MSGVVMHEFKKKKGSMDNNKRENCPEPVSISSDHR